MVPVTLLMASPARWWRIVFGFAGVVAAHAIDDSSVALGIRGTITWSR